MTESMPPEAAPVEPAGGEARALVFSDAGSAQRWAQGLPLTNVALVCETVQGQLGALSAAALAPRERARIAEVLRELIAHLHTELARRYAGKAQPAGDRELQAASHAIALWQGLWEQYSTCLKPLLEGDPDLAGVKPKILQRGAYVGKQLVLVHGLARRTVPSAIWHELHAYFRLAEMLECAVTAVSDDLIPNAVGISCYSTYSHALLLGLADPCAMTVKQIELTDRWLAMWARKVFPYAQQRESEGPVALVDLDSGAGARLAPGGANGTTPSMRFGYPAKLATSVRGRLKRLHTGANPAELQLGHDCSAEQAMTLLGYLDTRWYQLPRRARTASEASLEVCPGGLPGAYFRVNGRTFERNAADPVAYQGVRRLHTLEPIPDYDRGRDDAQREWAWERWRGGCDWRDATLVRTGDAAHRWTLEQLAIVSGDDGLRVGFVTRVALETPADLSLSLRLWPGTPEALSLRPLSAAGSADAPLPALVLAATPEEPASLVLPPRTFDPGRVLRSVDPGAERRFRLVRRLQRGHDFERVAFDGTN